MLLCTVFFFFFKQKTAYEMRISDWSSDVCSSDLAAIEKVVIVAIGVPVIAGEPDRHLFGYNRPANESAGRIIIEISVAGADHPLGGVRRVTREHLDRAAGRVATEQRADRKSVV